MIYRLLADAVVLLHFTFVIFVVLGGFLLQRWPRVAYIHLPAAVWGVLIEFAGWICPLTPLENHLRRLGGEAGYEGGFIDHYIIPILYPGALTRTLQYALGAIALLINILAYVLYFRRRRAEKPA